MAIKFFLDGSVSNWQTLIDYLQQIPGIEFTDNADEATYIVAAGSNFRMTDRGIYIPSDATPEQLKAYIKQVRIMLQSLPANSIDNKTNDVETLEAFDPFSDANSSDIFAEDEDLFSNNDFGIEDVDNTIPLSDDNETSEIQEATPTLEEDIMNGEDTLFDETNNEDDFAWEVEQEDTWLNDSEDLFDDTDEDDGVFEMAEEPILNNIDNSSAEMDTEKYEQMNENNTLSISETTGYIEESAVGLEEAADMEIPNKEDEFLTTDYNKFKNVPAILLYRQGNETEYAFYPTKSFDNIKVIVTEFDIGPQANNIVKVSYIEDIKGDNIALVVPADMYEGENVVGYAVPKNSKFDTLLKKALEGKDKDMLFIKGISPEELKMFHSYLISLGYKIITIVYDIIEGETIPNVHIIDVTEDME